ncbi:uridine kinase family-domain-containing protein [Tirmania nivea]|nr:uridine kinase family-domain-containing protein [Tirmania nivea]
MTQHYIPPWANTHIIGIAGSSGSGKTSLAMKIVGSLSLPWVVILSMDSFYKSLTPEQSELAFRNEYDFDSPDSIDFDVLVERLHDLKMGKKAEIPTYSFEEHQRMPETTTIYSCHVLILEGIFALYDPRVLALLDMKIFVDTDSDICLARRLARDIKYRGRDIEGAIKQWMGFVKPNFELYVDPQRKNADILVPRGIDNIIAISMVVKHIQRALWEKSKQHMQTLVELGEYQPDEPLSSNIDILPDTTQMKGMHTIIHNQETSREDFIFYFDRISTLLIERAMNHLPYSYTQITTARGYPYAGQMLSVEVSVVVILRSGGTLENGLKRIVPEARIGRMLIQSNSRTGEPELHFLKLPPALGDHRVLLLDPQVASGAGAIMAMQVLKDYGVKEENIILVTYLSSVTGLRRVTKVYPRAKIVTACVREGFERRWVDTRYFGC